MSNKWYLLRVNDGGANPPKIGDPAKHRARRHMLAGDLPAGQVSRVGVYRPAGVGEPVYTEGWWVQIDTDT